MVYRSFIVLALLTLPTAAVAQTGTPNARAPESHEHKHGEKGAHGGVLQDIAGYEGELVASGGKISLYLTDHATKKLVLTEGMRATVLIRQNNKTLGSATLNTVGDRLEGAGEIAQGADAVVTLRLPNGKSSQAKFEGGH